MGINDFCVISNNCLSGYWYRDVINSDYEHPFIWSTIKLSDFIKLIENFDTINFSNVDSSFGNEEYEIKETHSFPKITIEGEISVYFIHYIQVKRLLKEPIIRGNRVLCNDVLSYAKEAWIRRSNRMNFDKKRVWVCWDDAKKTDIDLNEFILLAKKRKNEIFVLFTPKNTLKPLSENIFILPITDYNDVPKHAFDLEKLLTDF